MSTWQHRIHVVADLPSRCLGFAWDEARTAELAGGTPFRRCFTVKVGTPWHLQSGPELAYTAALLAPTCPAPLDAPLR